MKMFLWSSILFLSLLGATHAVVPRDGNSGKLPVMGWNSYNAHSSEISHQKILSAAEQLSSQGLKELGYEYVNVDDGWQSPLGRDNKTLRMLFDEKKFPHGMDGTATSLHDLGFKMGIYSDAGTFTCGKMTGSLYFERLDAVTWADWGMDYDINSDWARVVEILAYNILHLNYVDFWGHNDMDLLQVGNGNLTKEETRSHFALWAGLKSPLLISTPLSNLTESDLKILKNKILIGFNQDGQHGPPARPYKWGANPDWTYNKTHPAEYYSGQSKAGTLILMFNPVNNTESKTAVWQEVPELQANESYKVTDVWTGDYLGCVENEYQTEVAPHDTAAILVTGRCY